MKQHCRMAFALPFTNSQGCIGWTEALSERLKAALPLFLTTVVTMRFRQPSRMFQPKYCSKHARNAVNDQIECDPHSK
jgi:hypothetical protein